MNRLPRTAWAAFLRIDKRECDNLYAGEFVVGVMQPLACINIEFYSKPQPQNAVGDRTLARRGYGQGTR
jgi:hypothetical protein